METKTNAQVALECAIKLFEGKGTSVSSATVTRYADIFLEWLDNRS
jgi:hypothetical protein